MTQEQDITIMKNPDVQSALTALKRAAETARKIAIQTDTGIVVERNGQPVYIDASTLRKEAEEQSSSST